jgi:hypothetical protein
LVDAFRIIGSPAATSVPAGDVGVIRCGDKNARWIHTVHPAARDGGYAKQKTQYLRAWREADRAFVNNHSFKSVA